MLPGIPRDWALFPEILRLGVADGYYEDWTLLPGIILRLDSPVWNPTTTGLSCLESYNDLTLLPEIPKDWTLLPGILR